MEINWSDFESKYWSPEKGKGYDVVLSRWRQEFDSFDNEKTMKPVLVFDVLAVDGKAFVNPKTFTTSAHSFAEKVRPIIEIAERGGVGTINVHVEYTTEKRYIVKDLSGWKHDRSDD